MLIAYRRPATGKPSPNAAHTGSDADDSRASTRLIVAARERGLAAVAACITADLRLRFRIPLSGWPDRGRAGQAVCPPARSRHHCL